MHIFILKLRNYFHIEIPEIRVSQRFSVPLPSEGAEPFECKTGEEGGVLLRTWALKICSDKLLSCRQLIT